MREWNSWPWLKGEQVFLHAQKQWGNIHCKARKPQGTCLFFPRYFHKLEKRSQLFPAVLRPPWTLPRQAGVLRSALLHRTTPYEHPARSFWGAKPQHHVSVVSITRSSTCASTRYLVLLQKNRWNITNMPWALTVEVWSGPQFQPWSCLGTNLPRELLEWVWRYHLLPEKRPPLGRELCCSSVWQHSTDMHWDWRGRRGPELAFQGEKRTWIQSLLQGQYFSFVMNGIRVLVQAKYCRQCWC